MNHMGNFLVLRMLQSQNDVKQDSKDNKYPCQNMIANQQWFGGRSFVTLGVRAVNRCKAFTGSFIVTTFVFE